ncbi:MdBV-1-5a [Microplitis demolitor]|nr:MdBV-1-5a [Microplitis demolitor]
MKVVVDFVAYDLPHKVKALKEFGMSSVHLDKNNYYETSHYVFKPPHPWSELPDEFRFSYEEQSKQYGIPWEAGSTPYNDMIPAIVQDLETVTEIYVDSPKSKVILEDIIGKFKPISILEGLGWSKNDARIPRKTCKVHTGENNTCAYYTARCMGIWFNARESLAKIIHSEPTVKMMKHIDIDYIFD